MVFLKLYYALRPLIPRWLQLAARRLRIRTMQSQKDVWPILEKAGEKPEGWTGWPEGKDFALVLTHDVEWEGGQDKCELLAGLEEERGFRSSFNLVPERYDVSPELRRRLVDRGFEIGVHGLNHDGKLYNSWKIFRERAKQINRYIQEWGSVGFRSPSVHHNFIWICELNIEYDASAFDTDPYQPQPDGACTIFPFVVPDDIDRKGYVELPYTLAQDSSLFVLMRRDNIGIWKGKLDWIAERGGMALLITHPDYMYFGGGKPGPEEYPAEYYEEFLDYVKTKYEGRYWHALPRDVARFWKKRDGSAQ